MKKVFALALLMITPLVSNSAFGQMATNEQTISQFITNTPIKSYPNAGRVTGSPYENELFVLGSIMKDGKALSSNVALRYNAMRDEIEVKGSIAAHNETARVLKRQPEIYVKILNKLFVFVSSDNGIRGYFTSLSEGEKFHLYKKTKKEYEEGMTSVSSLTRDVPAGYKDKEAYYLVSKETNELTEFPNSRNGKFSIFGKKKKEMKNYAKTAKLNVNKEYALVKLVQHYNTL